MSLEERSELSGAFGILGAVIGIFCWITGILLCIGFALASVI